MSPLRQDEAEPLDVQAAIPASEGLSQEQIITALGLERAS